MARNRYNAASSPGTAVTRGGPAQVVGVPETLPIAGVDQGDGTAAVLTSGGGGGNGNATAIAITATQTTLVANAAAVEITQLTPPTTRFLVYVTNIGGNPLYYGAAGVTSSNGVLLNSGQTSPALPLGPTCPLYAFSPIGTAVSVIEFE